MKISLKICALIFLFFLICITYTNAANIDMNLQSNSANEFLDQNSISNENNTNQANINNSNTATTSRVVSATTTSEDNEFLTAENILSIIIIVIGILLIFLAVAILIRFK